MWILIGCLNIGEECYCIKYIYPSIKMSWIGCLLAIMYNNNHGKRSTMPAHSAVTSYTLVQTRGKTVITILNIAISYYNCIIL